MARFGDLLFDVLRNVEGVSPGELNTLRFSFNQLQQLLGLSKAVDSVSGEVFDLKAGPVTIDNRGITIDSGNNPGRRPEIVFLSGDGSVKGRLAGYSASTNEATAYLLTNLYYDGTNWNLDDTSRYGTVVQGSAGSADGDNAFQFRSGPASSNPASLVQVLRISHGGLVGLRKTTQTLDTDGAITASSSYIEVDTFESAASDNLVTISGASEGDIVILKTADSARTVVVKDGTGNINCAGDFSMDSNEDRMMLLATATNYVEIARSNNT